MSEIVAVIVGAVLGFVMPYGASAWDRITRSKRILAALNRELAEVQREIQEKMNWIGRDVSSHIDQVDKERTAETKEGMILFLGEQETFEIPRRYWKEKYTEFAELIEEQDYSVIYRAHRLADAFEAKFRDMKRVFETTYNKKEEMALVCFSELREVTRKLNEELTIKDRS